MKIKMEYPSYAVVNLSSNEKNISEESSKFNIFSNLIDSKKSKLIEKDVILFDKREENIPIFNENLIKRVEKIQAFFKYEYEDFQRAKDEHNRRVREDESYNPQIESKYFKEKKLYYAGQYVILDSELVRLDINEYSTHEMLFKSSYNSKTYEWLYQSLLMTEQNKYENAPEFEAFVKKWMNKGYSEDEALERASLYAQVGLLDYGNQRAIIIDHLEYSNKKQHGLHQIENSVLKKSILQTFDSLDSLDSLGNLVYKLFADDKNIVFQELINEFASKLKIQGGLYALDNKKYSNYKNMHFDGNINITDKMNQVDKNFVYDILIEYFKEHLSEISQKEKINNELYTEVKDAMKLLISNFEKNVKQSNRANTMLEQYTRNTREKII